MFVEEAQNKKKMEKENANNNNIGKVDVMWKPVDWIGTFKLLYQHRIGLDPYVSNLIPDTIIIL